MGTYRWAQLTLCDLCPNTSDRNVHSILPQTHRAARLRHKCIATQNFVASTLDRTNSLQRHRNVRFRHNHKYARLTSSNRVACMHVQKNHVTKNANTIRQCHRERLHMLSEYTMAMGPGTPARRPHELGEGELLAVAVR